MPPRSVADWIKPLSGVHGAGWEPEWGTWPGTRRQVSVLSCLLAPTCTFPIEVRWYLQPHLVHVKNFICQSFRYFHINHFTYFSNDSSESYSSYEDKCGSDRFVKITYIFKSPRPRLCNWIPASCGLFEYPWDERSMRLCPFGVLSCLCV